MSTFAKRRKSKGPSIQTAVVDLVFRLNHPLGGYIQQVCVPRLQVDLVEVEYFTRDHRLAISPRRPRREAGTKDTCVHCGASLESVLDTFLKLQHTVANHRLQVPPPNAGSFHSSAAAAAAAASVDSLCLFTTHLLTDSAPSSCSRSSSV